MCTLVRSEFENARRSWQPLIDSSEKSFSIWRRRKFLDAIFGLIPHPPTRTPTLHPLSTCQLMLLTLSLRVDKNGELKTGGKS